MKQSWYRINANQAKKVGNNMSHVQTQPIFEIVRISGGYNMIFWGLWREIDLFVKTKALFVKSRRTDVRYAVLIFRILSILWSNLSSACKSNPETLLRMYRFNLILKFFIFRCFSVFFWRLKINEAILISYKC